MAAPSPQALHIVEIRPPSARAETWNVLRAGALIVLATWIYIADTARPAPAGASGEAGGAAGSAGAAGGTSPSAAGGAATSAAAGRAATRDLMPYQRLFPSLDGAQQLMFRELREGLLEAENLRSATRRWPPPVALAGRGIPPFADVPASRRRAYRWELRQEGLYVNYLGVPADAGAPAFLLLVQEPDPRAPADPAAPPPGAPDDEVHHRLADGSVLHVSIWMRVGGRFGAPASSGSPGSSRVAAGAATAPAPPAAVIAVPYAEGWTQLLAGGSQP